MTDKHYWPGSLTWEDISTEIRSWSDGPTISRDEAYRVAHIAGLLGIFGFPENSRFNEEKQVSERDTKFAGFAYILADELGELYEDFYENWDENKAKERTKRIESHIARRAYDLVNSACGEIAMEQPNGMLSQSGMLDCVTDLTELPEEKP